MPNRQPYLASHMRYIFYLCLISATALLGGCSPAQDDHDGQYVTDADGQHFHPRIPFSGSVITTEAQKLMDDFISKHRADGAIKKVEVKAARVDAVYVGILNGNFSFSGQAVVTITGTPPVTVMFRERITGSLVPGDNRLLDHWFFPLPEQSSFASAYVSGLDSWRAALASEADANDRDYRLAQALSVCQLIVDLKDHPDPGALSAWEKANAIAWEQRALINLPLLQ